MLQKSSNSKRVFIEKIVQLYTNIFNVSLNLNFSLFSLKNSELCEIFTE